jgi:hypothetical protein
MEAHQFPGEPPLKGHGPTKGGTAPNALQPRHLLGFPGQFGHMGGGSLLILGITAGKSSGP